jgi:tetratricopeptide (TPR) repeat protein
MLLGTFLAGGCAHRPFSSSTGGEGAREDDAPTEAALTQRIDAYTQYILGVRADLVGEPEEAVQHLLAAATAQPTQKGMVVQVVGRLLQSGQAAAAVELLKRATALPTADAELFAWLGFAYRAQGNLPEAIAANRQAIERDPRLIQGYRNLALLYTENQQPDAALEVLNQAAILDTPNVGFLVALAELYAGHGQLHPEQAELCRSGTLGCLDRAVALEPEDPFLRQRIAEGFRLNGRVEQAETILLDLLEEEPGLPMLRETLAEIYLVNGRKEDAADQLEIIVQERPSNDRAAFFLGTIAYERGDYAEAERLFRRTMLLRSDFEPAYCDLAAVILAQDRPKEALKIIEEARAIFKKSFQLEYLMAATCARLERYQEAIRYFKDAEVLAEETAPDRLGHGFYFQFGAAAERHGDFSQAERHFRKCLDEKPDFAEALNYLGYMWAERGENLEEARELIERAIELEPENGAFLDSMAWVLFKLGQPAEALPWMRKSIELAEEPDATLYDHLGDILAATGETEEARAAWERSLDLKPDELVRAKLRVEPVPTPPLD